MLRDGVVSEEHVRGGSGWREEGRRLPAGTVRAAIIGFDLVRNEFGGWRVLEDNSQNPSGTAYAIAARDLMDALLPDLPRPAGLLDPRRVFPMLRNTLAAGAYEGALALLSPGPDTPAWYEHRRLAEGAGLLLVSPDQLHVDGTVVRLRSTGSRIGALYLRLDGELRDLTDSDGNQLGEEILAAAAARSVFLANAPGSGIADDKALYCAVPELINYYLGEHPLLESVPTYRTEDEIERQSVLERVGELVTKPVDGHGGAGVLIGPAAPAIAVATRRAEIIARPDAWVAQEVVPLSSLPTFAGDRLEPRHIDLRLFVHVRGTGPSDVVLAPVGLTRVAPHGSMVVNSSRGGGAKDTWILGAEGEGDVRPGW